LTGTKNQRGWREWGRTEWRTEWGPTPLWAIDKAPKLVQCIKDDVTLAVVADATDAKAMESLNVKGLDTTIVCIGSVLSDSILVVLNLEEIGVKRIFAKAISTPHVRILKKLGVMEILFPEKDIALSLAERLHNPNLIDYLPFMEGYGVIELEVPQSLIGKTLRGADMINRFGVQVVAIKEIIPEGINFIPTGNNVYPITTRCTGFLLRCALKNP